MLDAGIVYCQHCGHTFEGFYYHNGTINLTVVLKRSITGKFFATPVYKEGDPVYKRVYLAQNIDKENTAFYSRITVGTVSASGEVKEFNFDRICSGCGRKLLNPELGTVPTYVVAVIGSAATGKSCWINSVAYQGNLNKINATAIASGSKYYLDTNSQQAINTIEKTEVNNSGETRMLFVKERDSVKPIAAVLIMDFSGELFDPANKDTFLDRASKSVFTKNEKYDGVDAVVFMDAADHPESTANDTKNQVKNTTLLETKPVAYILNKIDVYFKNVPEKALSNQDRRAPLLTQKTFKSTEVSSISREELTRRITLQTYLVGALRETASGIFLVNKDAVGFAVKTGASAGTQIDLSDSVNSIDPLLWLLNKLDIFPIK